MSSATPARRDGRRAGLRGTARERLLDAAERVFGESGYRGASVDDVAAAAGATKGALYWHFASKQELFFALVEERVDSRVREFLEFMERAGTGSDPTPAVSSGLARVVDEQRQMFLLMHEYWALAVRDPGLREHYVERQRALRTRVAQTLEARAGGRLPVDAERLATGLIAFATGLAEERIADPDAVPDETLGEVLSLILEGLAARMAADAARPDAA
ncbi:MAG TPA: TetR family transcriptional regulator [Thermoleophilaceae bacterium]|jgi:AcrR family transcriptional regulator